MRKQIITSFFDASSWRFELYDAVFGSAVAGNGDAARAVRYPDAELSSRVRVDHPYFRGHALNLIKVNQLWQRAIGKLNGARIVDAGKIKSLLSCPLPGVRLANQISPGYACSCTMCPNCYYRRLVYMYGLFARTTEPGMNLYEHKLVSYSPDTRQISAKMVEVDNEMMARLYAQGKLPWTYGASTTIAEWQPATQWAASTWKVVTRTLATTATDTRVKTGDLDKGIGPTTGDVHEASCRLIGEATPKTILAALSTDFRYPAALLYENTPDTTFYQVYAALRGNGKRSACRARTYGMRRRTYELELKGAIDVIDTSEEQRFCWRPAFEAADVEQPAGDQRGRLRLPDPDHRILCPA